MQDLEKLSGKEGVSLLSCPPCNCRKAPRYKANRSGSGRWLYALGPCHFVWNPVLVEKMSFGVAHDKSSLSRCELQTWL